MTRTNAATAAAVAERFFARQHPGYAVIAKHPAYSCGIVLSDGHELVFVRCSMSEGAAFADNDQTREQAEAQAVEWMSANAAKLPEELRFRFNHFAVKVLGDGKAVIRHHVDCFDE